uniref:Ring finger protein n=1 Tax=Hordeum vulgare TaxID=4513 RepID=O49869_HORVU|nr:ring finger protein [Hordeum vulgare subsp. vulgare]
MHSCNDHGQKVKLNVVQADSAAHGVTAHGARTPPASAVALKPALIRVPSPPVGVTAARAETPLPFPASPACPPLPFLIPSSTPPRPDPVVRPRTNQMASARRLLQTYPGQFQAAEPPDALGADSDVVVILAALLCALLCVVGLAAVTGCARSRRGAGGARSAAPDAAAPSKGLKKRALMALPRLAYEDAVAARGAMAGEEREGVLLSECAICLSEFADKEEIRVLPQCGHGFHVACVDAWLRAHSSCPSCRRVVVVIVADAAPRGMPPQPKRCRKCEAMEEASSSSSSAAAQFLP